MSQHHKKQVVQEVEEWERKLVEKYVSRVIGKYGLMEQDRLDKQQEFLLYVLVRKRSARFGKLDRIERQDLIIKWLDHKVWKTKQGRRAKKVQVFEQARSLSDVILDEGSVVTLGESEAIIDPAKSTIELWDLAQDVRSVLPKLSERQKFVCAEMSQGTRKGRIRKKLRISRQTLTWEIARIRKIFTDHGLKGYL